MTTKTIETNSPLATDRAAQASRGRMLVAGGALIVLLTAAMLVAAIAQPARTSPLSDGAERAPGAAIAPDAAGLAAHRRGEIGAEDPASDALRAQRRGEIGAGNP
jgi:hypothetical protein